MIIFFKKLALRYSFLFFPFFNFLNKFSNVSIFSKWALKYNKLNLSKLIKTNNKNLTRYDLYNYLIEKFDLNRKEITYLEFGVYTGESLKYWTDNLNNTQSRFFGFDTFTGLPEDYANLKKGHFSVDSSLPEINDERIKYEIGLFQETLPNFLNQLDTNKQFIIHLDADLYSSTLYVLFILVPKLPKGTIVIFDEFSGSFCDHEFKAFIDFSKIFSINFKMICHTRFFLHTAFIID